MINSVTSSVYMQPTPQNNYIGQAAESRDVANTQTEQSKQTNGQNLKENMLTFIANASKEEADARVESIKRGGAPLVPINLNKIIASGNSFEILGRINRLSDQLRVEAESFLKQEVALINQGQAAGKTSKDILNDIVDLYGKQTELFKLSMGWEGMRLSDPANFSKLVELTPDYVDMYA